MSRVQDDYLRDMLENAEKALSFVNGMSYEDFETDDKAVYARSSAPLKLSVKRLVRSLKAQRK